jgi:hypothetical protein
MKIDRTEDGYVLTHGETTINMTFDQGEDLAEWIITEQTDRLIQEHGIPQKCVGEIKISGPSCDVCGAYGVTCNGSEDYELPFERD